MRLGPHHRIGEADKGSRSLSLLSPVLTERSLWAGTLLSSSSKQCLAAVTMRVPSGDTMGAATKLFRRLLR